MTKRLLIIALTAATLTGSAYSQVREVSEAYTKRLSTSAPSDDSLPIAATQRQVWEIKIEDVNMANTFARWAKAARWQFRWDAGKHIFVEAPGRIEGTFEEALAVVIDSPGISLGSYPLEVCFYPNTPPLARVTRRGEQEQECK